MWVRAESGGIVRYNLFWELSLPGYNQVHVFIKTQCECVFLLQEIWPDGHFTESVWLQRWVGRWQAKTHHLVYSASWIEFLSEEMGIHYYFTPCLSLYTCPFPPSSNICRELRFTRGFFRENWKCGESLGLWLGTLTIFFKVRIYCSPEMMAWRAHGCISTPEAKGRCKCLYI